MRSLATTTPRRYQRDWAYFQDWCQAHHFTPLPCDASVVARFISTETDVRADRARQRVSAINAMHRQAGFAPPGTVTAVRRLLSSRTIHRDKARVAIPDLPARGYPAGLFGRRDALLLWLTCILGISARDIRALQRSDLTCDEDTIRIGGGHDIEVLVDGDDPFGLLPVWRRWAVVQSAMDRARTPVGVILALDNAHPVDPDEPPSLLIPPPPSRDSALIPGFRRGLQWKSADLRVGLSERDVQSVVHSRLSWVQLVVDDDDTEGSDTFSDGTVPQENPQPPVLSTDYYAVGMAKRRKSLRQLDGLDDVYASVQDQSAALEERLKNLMMYASGDESPDDDDS